MWTLGRRSRAEVGVGEHASLALPEDVPLDSSGLKRFSDYRLEPAIDVLCRQLQAWLDTPAGERVHPPRIGLFGGLGQGKSSAIGVALERIEARRTWRKKIRDVLLGPRIARFDVSFFKADELEWRFFTAVLWRRTLRNLALVVAVVTLVVLGLGSIVQVVTWWNIDGCVSAGWVCARWLVGAWLTLFVLVAPMLRRAFKTGSKVGKAAANANPGKGLYIAFRDLAIQSLARTVRSLPYIVVIDDLDRARVEQQRSFLRALTRFSRRMGFAVVVCMDDSELLAAAADPEAPEELLRKNLTVELRVPERSREDVALLAATCVREFVKSNSTTAPTLMDGLSTVQFVGDLSRVLMLDSVRSLNSPRKVQRLLTHVAMQADQLHLSHPDDLSALLRLEGLHRLAPPLRQHMDALRHALEANRVEAFEPTLAELRLEEQRACETRCFFERTRMMQPALRDGWFRLMGGFAGLHVPKPSTAWSVPWHVGPRSVDFLRVFVEAAQRDADGYAHSLTLTPDATGDIFTFELPGGTREDFSRDDLPAAVRTPTPEHCANCWLAWLCALRNATPARRHAICRRALAWADETPAACRAGARDLVFREALSDAQMWEQLQPSQRHWWWDRVHETAELSFDRIIGVALQDRDFADAWRILVRPHDGRFRDGRKVLTWWHHLVPEVDPLRLPSEGVGDPVFGTTVWPAPDLVNSNGARAGNVLLRHTTALGNLRADPRLTHRLPNPLPIREALRRVLDDLLPQHMLALLAPMAFEGNRPIGERWSLDVPRRWIQEFEKHALYKQLKDSVVDGSALHDDMPPSHVRALLILALLGDWTPRDPQGLVDKLGSDEIEELIQHLEDRSRPCDWLARAHRSQPLRMT